MGHSLSIFVFIPTSGLIGCIGIDFYIELHCCLYEVSFVVVVVVVVVVVAAAAAAVIVNHRTLQK